MSVVPNALAMVTGAAQGKASSVLTVGLDVFLPSNFPSFGEIRHAFTTGDLEYFEYKKLAQFHGICVDTNTVANTGLPADLLKKLEGWWGSVLRSQIEWPSVDEAIELWYRGYWSEAERDKSLAHSGVWETDQVRHRLELYDNYPEPQRLIGYAQKQAWSPYIIKAWGLDTNYPTYLERYAKPSGETWDTQDPIFDGTGLPPQSWFRAEWYSHWAMPNLNEVLEIVHRLRPGFNAVGAARDPSGIKFTDKELADYLQYNNIPPYWQERIMAVSHPLPQHRHLGSLFDAGIIDQTEVEEYLRDEGYWPRDVDVLAKEIVLKDEIAETKRIDDEIVKVSIDAYTLGLMSEEELTISLYRSRLKTLQQVKDFDAKLPAEQSVIAAADPYANAQIASFQLKQILEQAKSGIEGIKKQFLGGEISKQTAEGKLSLLGVVPASIKSYINTWVIEFHPKHKELETKELLDSAKYGFLSVPVLIARLSNLGWGLGDIRLLLANLNREVGIELQKQQVEAAKTIQEQQKAVQELAKQAAEQQKLAHETLLTHGSPSDLARWLSLGIISTPQYVSRMRALGIPQDVIDNDLLYAAKVLAAKAAKAAPKLPAPKPQKSAYPNESVLKRWLKAGVITQQQFDEGLANLGYSKTDVSNFDQSP